MLSSEIKALHEQFHPHVHSGAQMSPEAVTKICVTLQRLANAARALELACPVTGQDAELRYLMERKLVRPASEVRS